ncbi:hypothetical protein ABMY26_07200 (plasmid) [Azospirillum sp. HJ39]|uniref:hypothetical protein n=1 Tax=Azospirillum sp. HJ39 TaxID=3159496 RepID=UPI003557ED15
MADEVESIKAPEPGTYVGIVDGNSAIFAVSRTTIRAAWVEGSGPNDEDFYWDGETWPIRNGEFSPAWPGRQPGAVVLFRKGDSTGPRK